MPITKDFIANIVNQYDSLCLDEEQDRQTLIDHLFANIDELQQTSSK
jgi:hypothetical protein